MGERRRGSFSLFRFKGFLQKHIRAGSSDVRFVYLKGTKQVILERMRNRKRHFFPASLVDSQFETLEETEDAIVVDIT
jgi:gluconokinase